MTNPGSLEISEFQSQISTEAQEAAVRYADGHPADAESLLSAAIAEPRAGQEIRLLWLLLFELYRVQGNLRQFEVLAKRYRATFGKAAPEWLIGENYPANLPTEMRPGGPAYVALSNILGAESKQFLVRIHSIAANHVVVHIDFNKLTSVSSEGCEMLSHELELLIANGNGVYFSGGENLEILLRQSLDQTPKDAAYWRLLLDLYQLQGKQQQFESAALEYALFVEIDQPLWEPVLMPVIAHAAPAEKRDEPRYADRPEVMFLHGEMTGAHDPQLDAIRRFARDKEYVNVNLSRLSRIDSVCAANLGNTLQALSGLGKTVRIIRPNLLVATLLRMLKIDRHSTLVSYAGAA